MKNNIKLFITDIDGVWTDGGMYYDQTGNEWKKFNTADSAGVLFLKLIDIQTAIITGEHTDIVRNRADKLNIGHLFMGVKDKVTVAENLCHKLGIGFGDVAYIGDDINDIPLLQKVGLSACPINSPNYVSQYADWKLPICGGDGAFRFFVEEYLKKMKLMDKVLNIYLNKLKQGE